MLCFKRTLIVLIISEQVARASSTAGNFWRYLTIWKGVIIEIYNHAACITNSIYVTVTYRILLKLSYNIISFLIINWAQYSSLL